MSKKDYEAENAASLRGLIETVEARERQFQPYTGEIKKPETFLEAVVLDNISKYGNDNIFTPDPYKPGPHYPRLEANARFIVDNGNKPEYGANFWMHHFDLPNTKVITVYNVHLGGAEAIIDRFKGGGGLESRTTFASTAEEPDAVSKSQQTDFRTENGFGFHDFYRSLNDQEIMLLKTLLVNPELESSIELVEKLIAVNAEEEEMKKTNRAEYDQMMREYHESLESIDRALRYAEHGTDEIIYG